ncbi:RNA polymerase sigma factor [Streptomyces acidiscabies]|uniref:RNA polymerase sigma factor n=1 Tax=Streptomyces acidiscabies TaxID=42234 RepID=A0ABU4M4F2_9ACTN|nr:RNA polymerase sigma factor [Streptomyces acidiscabies]MDX3022925.1 RNA polymerase sigma factor [Streptomyces acidiscabies]
MHARIRAGDPEAFQALVRDHAQAVYRHGVRLTGDPSAGEDIVAITYLEAWRLRGRLRDEGDSPRPWLMGIATNVARNFRRAARRHERALRRMPVAEPRPDIAAEVVGRLTDRDRLAAAHAALARLRRPEREVIALCVWSGLSYADAALALGVRVGTVRSRLSRARTRLRALAAAELKSGQGPSSRELPAGDGQVPVSRTSPRLGR